MSNPQPDQAKVLACAERIKRSIGKENPAVAVMACLMIIQATKLIVQDSKLKKGGAV